ncbi:hypothetical protein [Achromobacter xylosoxidans]
MNEHNNAIQPLLTGDEIRAAVHQARSMTAPSDTTEPGDYVTAGAQTMLSKLRIPVAEVPLTHRCANCGAVFQGAGCPSCRLAAPVASAPVAGEAKNYPGDNVAERLDKMADDQPPGSQAQSDLYAAATIWRKHIAHRAAPQASAVAGEAVTWEAVRQELAIFLMGATGRSSKEWHRPLDNASEGGALARMRACLAAPQASTVAREAQPSRQTLLDAIWRHGNARAMAEHNIACRDEVRNTADALLALFDAAPQASDEDVRNAALEEAAKLMDQTLRSNGAALIRGLKRSRADKDGGQQRAGDGKTREAVDYPRGGALNFDDPVSASAEGIRSPSNACMHRNECRAMLERQTAARNTRLRDLAAEALTWMESSTEKPVSLCADLRTVLASSSSRNSQGGIDG